MTADTTDICIIHEWPVLDTLTVSTRGTFDLRVLATPQLAFMIEDTCVKAAEPLLSDGQVTLGTLVEIEHLAPAIPGQSVRVRVCLDRHEGRILAFSIQAHVGELLIARANHQRAIVELKSFKARWKL